MVSSISEKLGEINVVHLYKPPTKLRKENRIKTIQSSLEIEGNTLTTEQITALLENKRVIAPAKDILEVRNAIKVYQHINDYEFTSIQSFLKVHKALMYNLTNDAGKFRLSGIGIVQGSKVSHVAPRGNLVKGLMSDLFRYLKTKDDLLLI